jgi:hypothetical protein
MNGKRLPTILYLLLALCGLIVPVMHYRVAPEIIERSRNATGMLPSSYLFFRMLGVFIWLLPVPAFIGFVLSLRFAFFRNMEGVSFISICMLLCTLAHAAYCLCLLYFSVILRGG